MATKAEVAQEEAVRVWVGNPYDWDAWFAWRPVYLSHEKRWVWLRTIWRRWRQVTAGDDCIGSCAADYAGWWDYWSGGAHGDAR